MGVLGNIGGIKDFTTQQSLRRLERELEALDNRLSTILRNNAPTARLAAAGDSYAYVTDGTNTATSSGSDTLKFRSANAYLTVAVENDNATHGDNVLLTINSAAFAHNLLSATHTDTLAASVARGALIVGNSTPAWSELTIGTSGTLLRSDGTDAAWASLSTAGIAASSVTITAGNGLTGGGDLSANRTIDVAAADTTITVNADSIQVNQASSFSWNTGTHTFATETVHNGGLDIGTSGRFDSNVAASGSADTNFLFQPTTALTSGVTDAILQVKNSTPIAYLDIWANGCTEIGRGSTASSATAQVTIGGPTDATNSSVGVLCTFNGAASTNAGAVLGGTGSDAVAGGYFIGVSSQSASNLRVYGGVFEGKLGYNVARTVSELFGGSFKGWSSTSMSSNSVTWMGGCITQPCDTAMSSPPTVDKYACYYAGAATKGSTLAFTTKYGLYVAPDHSSSNLTTTYGVYVDATAAGATNTNSYGLRILEQVNGSTLNYGIYLDSATSTYKAIAIGETGNWIGWGGSGLLTLNAATAVQVPTTQPIYFRDSGSKISSSASNTLDLAATTINLTATTTAVSGLLTVTGTAAGGHIQLDDQAVAAGGLTTNGYVYSDDGTNNLKGTYTADGANNVRILGNVYVAAASKTVTGADAGATGDLLSSTCRGTKTLGANFFDATTSAGKTIRLIANGYYSTDVAAAGTLTISFALGGTSVASTGATAMSNGMSGRAWRCEVVVTQRTTGAPGTVFAQGIFTWFTGAGTPNMREMVNTATTSITTTGTLAMSLDATWGTADADNTITLSNATIET